MKKKFRLVCFKISLAALSLWGVWLGINFVIYPKAIIVPHHNIVRAQRQEFFQLIAKQRPYLKTIFILSPDHFSANQRQIIYADKTWQLAQQPVFFAQTQADFLAAHYKKDNAVMGRDHGIYNLLAEINSNWPQAKIVPLLLGQQLEFKDLEGLISYLNQQCQRDCLVIASVDFSHYLPRSMADIHDLETFAKLSKHQLSDDHNLEVDSPQSLYVVDQYIQASKSSWQFYLHTNASYQQGGRDTESTSHIFAWAQKSFFSPHYLAPQTFLVAKNLNRQRDSANLGERFFYGTAWQNLTLQEELAIGSRLLIKPADQDYSSLQVETGNLVLYLADDLAVAGAQTNFGLRLVFLPISFNGQNYSLLRYQAKSEALKKLFQFTNLPNAFFDSQEGVIELH